MAAATLDKTADSASEARASIRETENYSAPTARLSIGFKSGGASAAGIRCAESASRR
jgi:hypothetical protein